MKRTGTNAKANNIFIRGTGRICAFAILVCVTLSALSLAGCTPRNYTQPESIEVVTNGSDSFSISWTATEDAVKYRLYRKADDVADYKFVADLDTLTYTDTEVRHNVNYEYGIAAVYETGVSAITKSASVIIAESYEASIKSVTLMPDGVAFVRVACDHDSNSTILRADSENGDYVILGQTDNNRYYDKNHGNGKTYYYKARYTDGTGTEKETLPAATGTNAETVFDVPILMYHEFVTQEDLESGIALDEYAIFRSEFEDDLKWLTANGYTAVRVVDLIDYINGKGKIPEKPVILSIDDGKYGVYKHAYPLLKKYNMTATLAVIGDRIDYASDDLDERDKDPAPYCTWGEIREMQASGYVEIISHTQSLHVYNEGEGRYGANAAPEDTLEVFLPIAQKDRLLVRNKFYEEDITATLAMAYPYSKSCELADRAWFACDYKILFGGDKETVRNTCTNYFIYGECSSWERASVRRIARMRDRTMRHYIEEYIYGD